jgi:hypothetical protein
MRVTIATAVALVTAMAVSSCVENEVTFLIEHMKVQPSPPNCVTSTGDEKAATATIDLATANSFGGWYYVSNFAMIREEYDNLRAETDGIIVEGGEAYVTTTNGNLIGESAYYEFELFIPPESSDVVPAIAIPDGVIAGLAEEYGCPSMNNPAVRQQLAESIIDGDLNDHLVFDLYPAVYTRMRFLGHTQGGSEVETPEFSFLVYLCCNCLIDWSTCYDPCTAFCETPQDSEMCQSGVSTGAAPDDCGLYFYSPGATWMGYDIYNQPELQGCNITCTGTSS